MHRRIFILEDEPDMVRLSTDVLEADGYVVTSATHPHDALKKVRANPPDLMVLDIRLPDMDGIEVCKEIKRDPKLKHVPIIMVSAKSEETDVVVGLEVGADDYICKPFRQKELLARIKTVLRRHGMEQPPQTIVAGPLVLDTAAFTVTLFKKPFPVTPKEFDLLSYMVQMEGRVLTRNKIYETIWGVDFTGSSRTIDVHIEQLRRKLGKHHTWITTLKGIGYRFQID